MSVWIAETLIATTLLMALVMLLRRPVARWLGARAAYWLWLLPLARMALPALPQGIADPSPLQQAADQAGLPTLLDAAPVTLPLQSGSGIPWLEIAASLWLLGLILFLTVQAIGYIRFRHFILNGATLSARKAASASSPPQRRAGRWPSALFVLSSRCPPISPCGSTRRNRPWRSLMSAPIIRAGIWPPT